MSGVNGMGAADSTADLNRPGLMPYALRRARCADCPRQTTARGATRSMSGRRNLRPQLVKYAAGTRACAPPAFKQRTALVRKTTPLLEVAHGNWMGTPIEPNSLTRALLVQLVFVARPCSRTNQASSPQSWPMTISSALKLPCHLDHAPISSQSKSPP